MCGIIGYIGKRKALPILLKGLKNLEYRGYDSAGVAILSDKLVIRKKAGKVDELAASVGEIDGNIGIAHTRWATHGKVSDINAHPHVDCTGKIAIVHNGIIENYEELKQELEAKGHKFVSETDSEVIAHLIEEEMKHADFYEAFKRAINKLKGSYAILAIHEGDRVLLAARKGSPLVIGVGKGEYYVSSDIPSFLEWTKKVIYLHDYDMVKVSDSVKIENLKEGIVERPIDTVDWSAEEIEKGGFEHYMLKEIMEQNETIQRAIQQDPKLIKWIVDRMKEAKGIFFIGSGSSYHACLAGSYLFSKIAKLHVNVVVASEFSNYEHFLCDKTLVFAVSQSGETADVLDAVRAAKRHGSKVISIVNRVGSTLTQESDAFLLMNAGPEICVLSTKTYTSQVALMALLAYAFAGKLEEGKRELKNLYMEVYNLTSRAAREHIQKLARLLKDKEHIYLIGRGLQYATALEAALKIKESSYIHAEAFAAGELKHGNLALIEKGTPVIAFIGDDERIFSNIAEVKARGAFVIGVGSVNKDFDFWIKTPECHELNPIVQIIPMQILAYELTVLRGYDPDKPRNLAKSVTVL